MENKSISRAILLQLGLPVLESDGGIVYSYYVRRMVKNSKTMDIYVLPFLGGVMLNIRGNDEFALNRGRDRSRENIIQSFVNIFPDEKK